jgi:hypothetical protein
VEGDDAEHDGLAGERVELVEVEPGLSGLDRDVVDGRVGEAGQEAVLARVVGDEQRVAEADVERGRALDAVERALQRLDPVLGGLLGPRLHPGLVELDDVGARREQADDLVAHHVGERERHVALVCVVLVLRLLGHREGAGDGDLHEPVGVRAQELGVPEEDGLRARDRAGDARHGHRVAVAVEHRAGLVDVDAGERRGEPVRVALAADLAVGDDVEPGALLVADGGQRGGVLRLLQPPLVDPPEVGGADARRQPPPQLLAVHQPLRLRIGADETGGERRERHGRRCYWRLSAKK